MLLDESKDGKLQIEEIRKGIGKIMGDLKVTSKEFMEIIESLDRDGNGIIDY